MPSETTRPITNDTAILLPSYNETKLKLASVAEVLLTLAQERKDDERAHKIQHLLFDLAEDAFRLAVVGKYNRGKSSLMNALLGRDWLPTGILPLTSVITTVRYGTRERVLIRNEDLSISREVPLADLPQFITEEQNPGNRKRIDLAEIQLPSDLLRYGFLFIDTPGLGSGIAANTQATREFLPEIDAAVVVLSFESPLDESDVDLIAHIHTLGRKLFIALNKADLAPQADRQHVKSFVQQRIRERVGEELNIFPLSAQQGLRARRDGNQQASAESGVDDLERELVQFLTNQKGEIFLRRIAERIREALEQEKLEQLFAREVKTNQRKADLLASLEKREQSVLHELGSTFDLLAQRLPQVFAFKLRQDIHTWSGELKMRWAESPNLTGEYRDSSLDSFIRRRAPAVTQELVASAEEYFAGLNTAVGEFQRAGCELLGSSGAAGSPEGFNVLEQLKASAVEVGNVHEFVWSPPQEWFSAIPSNWIKQKARSRFERELSKSLASYADATLPNFENACRFWLERNLHEVERRFTGYVERLQSAKARAGSADGVSTLRDLEKQLDEMAQSAGSQADSSSGAPKASSPNNAYGKPCEICRKSADASLDALRRLQYQLIKNPALREENSRSGGFCPFHTWMYESSSSPQGIAQGYAGVLQAMARHLKNLSSDDAPVERLTSDLLAALPSRASCKICGATKVAEDHAIDEAIAGPDREAYRKSLCLVHLASVVAKEQDLDAAKALVRDQAAKLERLAQDMQQFSLKHNALRHYLSTEGERDAYLHGLMQLVGFRQLSFVRGVKDLL